MAKGYISYRNKNGIEYAEHRMSRRKNGKKDNTVIAYLGRVISKDKCVYRNRERGMFTYSTEKGFGDCSDFPEFVAHSKMILDFGDAWLLNELFESSGLKPILADLLPGLDDSLVSLLFYRVLSFNCTGAHVSTWWEGSYVQKLYPKAKIDSHSVSVFNEKLGDEAIFRSFFKRYLPFVSSRSSGAVLLDSTGLPNDIDIPLTAVNVHNGVVSNEIRLIYVLDRDSGFPLYFRYVAGNIVDVTTLQLTFNELKIYGIKITHAIVDAGYCSEDNLKELQGSQIPYVIRLVAGRAIFKAILDEHLAGLECSANLVTYRERALFIKRVPVDVYGTSAYAYLAIDVENRADMLKRKASKIIKNKKDDATKKDDTIRQMGVFVLISSLPIETQEILPLYYTRQAVEQVFDISKNYAELLPLRVHSEETLRGHLLMSFITTALIVYINKQLKGSAHNVESALLNMRNLKCEVYDSITYVLEPNRKMKDIAEHLNLEIPKKV